MRPYRMLPYTNSSHSPTAAEALPMQMPRKEA